MPWSGTERLMTILMGPRKASKFQKLATTGWVAEALRVYWVLPRPFIEVLKCDFLRSAF